MPNELHPVPAGLLALHARGFSAAAIGEILGHETYMGGAKKLRGATPFTVRDLVLIAAALQVEVVDLFDPRLGDLQIPPQFLDKRLAEPRLVSRPQATPKRAVASRQNGDPLQAGLFKSYTPAK